MDRIWTAPEQLAFSAGYDAFLPFVTLDNKWLYFAWRHPVPAGQPGLALHIWGSSNRLQTLFKHDWVDALWLMVYPLTVGAGKRLFADGTLPAAFKVTESHVSSKGMVAVNYERVSGN